MDTKKIIGIVLVAALVIAIGFVMFSGNDAGTGAVQNTETSTQNESGVVSNNEAGSPEQNAPATAEPPPAAPETTTTVTQIQTTVTPKPVTTTPAQNPTPTPTPAPVVSTPDNTFYTSADVAAHNSGSSCYSIVGGLVYDLTNWINKHPGGKSEILAMCGKNATNAFEGQHGGESKPEKILAGYQIGILK